MKYKTDYLRRKGNGSQACCETCKKSFRVRSVTYFKGKYLCNNCRQKTDSNRMQASLGATGKNRYTLQEALDKVYEVQTYASNKKKGNDTLYRYSFIHLSNALIGKKVKLILVEDE